MLFVYNPHMLLNSTIGFITDIVLTLQDAWVFVFHEANFVFHEREFQVHGSLQGQDMI